MVWVPRDRRLCEIQDYGRLADAMLGKESRTKAERHALAGMVLLPRPSGNPAGRRVIEADIRFQNIAKSVMGHEMLKGEKVAVKSPV